MASKVLLGDLKAGRCSNVAKRLFHGANHLNNFRTICEGLVYTMSGFNTKRSNNNFRLSMADPPYASMMTFLLKS
ncbi:hypothetical protein Bca101_027886 [Brassica carinata]